MQAYKDQQHGTYNLSALTYDEMMMLFQSMTLSFYEDAKLLGRPEAKLHPVNRARMELFQELRMQVMEKMRKPMEADVEKHLNPKG